MLLSGCWAVSDTPAVCVWKRISHERGFLAPNVSRSSRAQMRRAARYLAISSKKSIWALKKKRQPRREVVDVEAARERLLDVGEPVLECEGELLRGGRAGLADVVAGDRDRVPARHVARAPLDHVAAQAHRRVDRKAPLLLRDVLLEDVGLDRACELLGDGDALRRSAATTKNASMIAAGRVDRHRHR